MKKIIDSDPAPYPKTNTREIQAVVSFVNMLDLDRVKPDIKFLDKIPNTDGIIEIVNKSQIPLGKIDVQIKVLEKKNYLKPKYQCKKDFLASCEQSILPVLLVVVNPDSNIAYWHHIDKLTIIELSKKIKGKSVNLDFNQNNIINKNCTDYIKEWVVIIEKYQEKLFDYDLIKERSQKLDLELNELKNITNTAIGKTDPIFKEIHFFLDFYNRLLDSDFNTIKNILYPNIWKIGCGLYEYQENRIRFSLYPIPYGLNDVLIKQYDSQDNFYLQNVLSYIGHNRENPIKKKPEKYSYELIKKDTENLIENQPFLVKDKFLAEEYLFAFINEFHIILGLDYNNIEYSISELEFSLNTFLPLWIEQVINKSEYKDRREPSLFVIDYIYLHTYPEDIIKISDKVKKEIENGIKPSVNLKITSNDFNFQILQNLLAYIKQLGTKSIKREYEIRHKVNKSSYYTWEAWGEEKTVKNVTVFYNNFIRIYDLVIDTYFINLKERLQFYNDFNLLIIVVDFSRVSNSFSPSIEYYYLKSNTVNANKVSIYNSSDNNSPIIRENLRDYYNNDLVIEGINYRMISCTFSILDFIYEKTPILVSVKKLLKDRFEKYFEEKSI